MKRGRKERQELLRHVPLSNRGEERNRNETCEREREREIKEAQRNSRQSGVGDRHLVAVRERCSHLERAGAEDDRAVFFFFTLSFE